MIERNNTYDNYPDLAGHSDLFTEFGPVSDLLFFDIETTGLSAATSVIYLIGCLYVNDNKLCLTQFLSEGKDDEEEVLKRFLKLSGSFTTLVHFNGQTFDIPFIKKRAAHLGIPEQLDNMNSFDLYKKLRKYRDFFGLENARQVSFEKAAGYQRKDTFDGGELISVFGKFVGLNRLVCLKPSDNDVLLMREGLKEDLLCHNHDDVFGMVQILKLFDRLPGTPQVKKIDAITILEKSLKVCLSEPDVRTVVIPLVHTQLKLFYPNCKDYIYLPVEDRVVPKSMGSFIDKKAKEKAVKENCYTKHMADFIPLYTKPCDCPTHVFRESYESKELFIEVNEFVNSPNDFILKYVQDFIKKTTTL